MSEWKEYRLGDLCYKVCSGGTPKSTCSSYYEGGTIPWLNTKEINYNRIFETESHITEDGLNHSSAKWIDSNAVVVAMYGATAGRVAIAKVPMTTNQACCNLMIDSSKADYNFIYYYLSNSYKYLLSMANGAAQQNLNAQIIKDLFISLPSLDEQRSIASILSSLDSKIENNRKICANLEAQAQALFKHWFIDFAPFKDGKFVESELGMIPEGWRVGKLGEIADITMGQSPSGSSYNEEGNGSIFYQGRSEFGFRFPSIRLFTTEPKKYAEPLSTLLSVRAPVGDINVATVECCIGRGLASIKSKYNHHSFIYYLLMSMKRTFDVYNGEGTVFGCINKDTLNGISIVVPPVSVVKAFNDIVGELDCMILESHNENLRLIMLRDTLLPKLMSGAIKI